MRLLIIFLITLFISLEAPASSNCLPRQLSELLNEADRDTLVVSLKEDIEKGKELARPIGKLETELDDAIEAGDMKLAKQIESKLAKVRKPILAMNNDFMIKTAALFEKHEIPHLLYESNGQMIINLSLENAPKNNRALRLYERAKRLFGVEKVTITFAENVAYLRKGFFKASESRVEIGHNEILALIEGDVGVTPRHEFRHGIFAHKAKKDIPSLYHIKLRRSKNGKRLNNLGMYDKYMTTEEVYNWSTDLQTLSKKLRDATPGNEVKILKDISNKVNGSLVVHETAVEMSESLISRLQETIDQKVYTRLVLPEKNTLKFEDAYGRIGEIGFYGPEREKILDTARKIEENFNLKSNEYIESGFKKRGLKEKTSTIYKLARKSLMKDYLSSEEGMRLVNELDEAKSAIAQDAVDQLKSMQSISLRQVEEVKALKEILDKLQHADATSRPSIILDIRARMRHIGDNVKEVPAVRK